MINIHFSLYNHLWIKVDCDDRRLLYDIEDYMTDYKKGYQFMPKYKAGIWDGKISIFNKPTRTFPYGLFVDVVKHIKKDWGSDQLNITVEPEIYDMFGYKSKPSFHYDLAFPPYPYQQECIEALVKYTKGIVVVATAGGKSLIISYIIRNLPPEQSKSLIIVPTLQLVDQFKGDMIEYGFPENTIGCVNSNLKEFDKPVVVSTWQSLKNQIDKLELFDAVICDEVHTAQADTITEILKNCPNAKYRFGVTGTLPTNRLDAMNVKSFIGPNLKTFTGKDLADLGYVSKCVIKQLRINYKSKFDSDYHGIRDGVFTNPFRLSVIKGLVKKSNNSVLILIEKVEKEGEVLERYLREQLPDREVIFLSGRDKSDVRDLWRKDMNNRKDIVCIATYPIFQQGVNIPSLREIILASSTKSFIRVIQSLGRTLRKHVSKELGGAVLWDICDNVKHLKDHANKRFKHYIKEKHDVEELEIEEQVKDFF
jgi:superfamily II DNA or RNA helicase